nr:hypothetical protein [Tanacetum cinerariifolium]
MSTLKLADTHNMVAFLEKPTKSKGFEQIVDFLSAHMLRYALTVNPTIYDSCIESFWSTAMARTISGESQIDAWVDGKEIIITESSVRRDLQLADKKGVDCLSNYAIFENLRLMGKPKSKNTQVPQPSGSIKHVADETIYKELDNRLVRAITTASSLEAKQDSVRVDSSKDEQSLGEDASKQERKIDDIDADEDITLVNDQDDAEMFDVNDLHGEEMFVEKQVADKEVNDEVQKVVEEVVKDINTANLIVDVAQVNATGEVNAASIATTVSAAAITKTKEIT